ncbi:MAG: arylsulfatase [Planctomycetota bacterium]
MLQIQLRRLSLLALLAVGSVAAQEARPNIVLIMADDLGIGELGCYGQTKIRTPNIDALAAQGMRFTEAYSGSCVCAPARCTILMGQHTGHCYVRDNKELDGFQRGNREGQEPLPADTPTLGRWLQARGYATAAVGKWGLGGPETTGVPWEQGFDLFYGYLCQRQAHNYYPEHLWRNDQKVELEGNAWHNLTGAHYAPDLMLEEALGWLRKHTEAPFFLYYATPVPHAALQVPDDSLQEYATAFDEEPYEGKKGYLPHPKPRAAYAAMVTRMDRDIGRILELLDELGHRDDTLVVFTSDNGPTFNGGTDSAFFGSAQGRRGLKCQLYEGGIRAPLVARWPGRIAPGTTSAHICAHWDLWSTFADAIGETAPADLDGVSFLPTLLGKGAQRQHHHLYWEYHAGGGVQAARLGRWKAVRRQAKKPEKARLELYDLEADPAEAHDVAEAHPDVVEEVEKVFATRTRSPVAAWNFQ